MPDPHDDRESKTLELSESKGLHMVLDTQPQSVAVPVAVDADAGEAATPPADVDD